MAYLTGYALEPAGLHPREVQLTSIASLSAERTVPMGYMTLYYGGAATVRQIPKRKAEALRNRQHLYQISVAVNVHKVILKPLTFEDLKQTRMLNMERLSKAVSDRIEEYWRGYLREEGKSDAWIDDNVRSWCHGLMSNRLDLLPRLAKEPEFRHLALIVYRVVEGSEVFKLGTILDLGATKAECKSDSQLKVVIPWSLQ